MFPAARDPNLETEEDILFSSNMQFGMVIRWA